MPAIPPGSVLITPQQMYAQIGELTTAVRELKSAVDPAMVEVRHDLTDHESRLRQLEARKYVPPTALAWAIGVALTALAVLIAFLGLHH
jgi:hypothetical protein